MKSILVCNQKGGVGKSLIADEIAFSLERSGIPMAFIDLDQQGGTLHRTDRRSDADVVVVDTPGVLHSDMGVWMKDADVIVIPVRPTSRDIPPLLRMFEIVKNSAPETPVAVVINGWNRFTAAKDFKEWLRSQRKSESAELLTLPQSEQFVQASAAGISVVQYSKKSSAAKATLNIVNKIRELAGFEKE